MTKNESEKLTRLQALLEAPFAKYPDLSDQEREVATLASRGVRVKDVARVLGVGLRTAYRALDRAAEKVGRAEGRKGFTRDDFVNLVYERIRDVLEN